MPSNPPLQTKRCGGGKRQETGTKHLESQPDGSVVSGSSEHSKKHVQDEGSPQGGAIETTDEAAVEEEGSQGPDDEPVCAECGHGGPEEFRECQGCGQFSTHLRLAS